MDVMYIAAANAHVGDADNNIVGVLHCRNRPVFVSNLSRPKENTGRVA